MKLIKLVFFIFLGSLLNFNASATIWQTINQGYWNDGSIWSGGVIPPYSSADTFYINHPIVISNQITLQPGAFFLIDNGGGICGHERFNLHTNAILHVHGILELDSLEVPGGHIQNFITGTIILSYIAHFSIGGTMSSNGAMAVGPWFICHQPEYSFLTGVQELNSDTYITMYPNPASSQLYFQSTIPVNHVILKSLSGKDITRINTFNESYELTLKGFADGMYVIEFYDSRQKLLQVRKFVINN